MIRFSCPDCAEPLEYGNDAAGSRVKCPNCREKFAVPLPRRILRALVICWVSGLVFPVVGATLAYGTLMSESGSPVVDYVGVLGMALFYTGGLFLMAAWIVTLAWVADDARSRGAESGVWLLIVLLFPLLGLLVYLMSRPPGRLAGCRECGAPRLPAVKVCPHCKG